MSTKMMPRTPEKNAAPPAPRAGRSWLFDLDRPMFDLWNRFAGEMFPASMFPAAMAQTQPPMDLVEKSDSFVITTDLPGMKIEDIDIQVSDNAVTVSGERSEEKEEKGASYHRVERRYGRFSRTMALPCAVDADSCDARYADGVLTITLPKCEENQARKIQVRK